MRDSQQEHNMRSGNQQNVKMNGTLSFLSQVMGCEMKLQNNFFLRRFVVVMPQAARHQLKELSQVFKVCGYF